MESAAEAAVAVTDEAVGQLEGVVPILSVANLQTSIEYYRSVLGFDVAWQWGDPPYLASIYRDRVEVNLSQADAGELAISKVYFQVIDVDAYYERVTAAGASVDVALDERPYGMRDFRILDPSGNELSFGESVEPVEQSSS
jgi:catechol 2,3-dioxygenase-like lactoylglutathione lyase family enzyme